MADPLIPSAVSLLNEATARARSLADVLHELAMREDVPLDVRRSLADCEATARAIGGPTDPNAPG